ncbi:Protein of unknown function [Cotesia congregata]|uniref:Uncharacterized protein n=1 Tax=Cotesia congregata TaxID=51543 RepID=A0A8J2MS50_COTCN|nr:Protein of unknown function [Cotesia congregata]
MLHIKATYFVANEFKELAQMCFTNNSSSVVISEDLLGNDWDPGGNSMIIIDRKFKKQITGFMSAYPTYVLSFDTMKNLKMTLEHLQQSTIWSIKSPFLIVKSKSQRANARKVLEFMWQQDLLAAYYICSDEDSTNVFTLNPFKSYAPAPWVNLDKLSGNNTKTALFALKICESITFDKAQELNGHEINVAFFFDFKNVPPDKINIELSKTGRKIHSIETLLAHVNAERRSHFFPRSIKSRSFLNGYLNQLVDKTGDVMGKTRQLADTNYKYMDIITAYNEVEFSILTKKSNYLEAVSQVTCNYQFLFLTVFVLILIAIIVMINNKFDISGSIMYVMNLTAGMGVLIPLDRLSMRIIYLFGFVFIFTVMPDFQGQVSAILSKPLMRNVESLKDLYDNRYYVFYDGTLHNDMVNEKLWVIDEDKQYLKKSNFSELVKCAVEAQFNASIACIESRIDQLHYSSRSKQLHVSKDVIFKKYYIHWSRKNWSIKDKIDRASFASC